MSKKIRLGLIGLTAVGISVMAGLLGGCEGEGQPPFPQFGGFTTGGTNGGTNGGTTGPTSGTGQTGVTGVRQKAAPRPGGQ